LVSFIMTLDNSLEGIGVALELEESNVHLQFAFLWLAVAVLLGGQLTILIRWLTVDIEFAAPFVHAGLSYFAIGLLFASTLRLTQTSSFLWIWIGFTTAWIISRILHMTKHYLEKRETAMPSISKTSTITISYPYLPLPVRNVMYP